MKKLFSIFFALALLLPVRIQAQTSMPQRNLRQIQNVEVANKKSVVQGGNPIIAAKERIAQRQTQLRNNKAMQDYSLLNKVNETQLKARAMAAMAQQGETIKHNLGYIHNLDWLWGNSRYSSYVMPQKDDGIYFACFYSTKSWGTSFNDNEWLEGTNLGTDINSNYTLLYSYIENKFIDIVSARAQFQPIDDGQKAFDIYYTDRDGKVYNIYVIAGIDATERNWWYLTEESDKSVNFTTDQMTISNYGEQPSGAIGYELWVQSNSNNNKYITDMYLFADKDISTTAIPSGIYNIDATDDAYSVAASSGYNNYNEQQLMNVNPSFLCTYTGDEDAPISTPIWFFSTGKVTVFNPTLADKPQFIKIDATGYWSEPTITVKIGTEPTKRTITVNRGNNGTEDGNNVLINHWEPVLAVDGNTYTFYQGSRFTFTPQPKDGWRFVRWTGINTSDIIDNGDGTYSLTMGAKNYTVGAVFEEIPAATYTVSFVSNNASYGSVSAMEITGIPAGAPISINGNKITINNTTITANQATNTAQYGYTFNGWDKKANNVAVPANVTEDFTIRANFTRTTNTYDITFKNADGTTLKKSDGTTDAVYSVAYGETPAYDGATPTKAADNEYTYTFNGWDNEIVAVTGTATYTATYTATPNSYTLTWTTDGDALTGTYTSGTVEYGTTITQPETPTKASTVQYAYTFNGWDPTPAATMPAATTEYTATWTQTLRQYALNVAAGANGTVSGGGTYDYGTEHNITATPNTNYHFAQWQDGNTDNPRTITIDENTPNVTYTATFEIDGTPEIVLEEDGTATDNGVATTYAALLAKYGEGAAGGAKAVNVTINRSMSAGQWNTIALPFDVDPDTEYTEWDGHIFDMSNSTATTASMDIYFERIMDIIEAGKPYLFLVGEEITSMRFEGKILKTFTTQSYTAQSGDVSFHSVFTPTEYVKEKSYIFLINNRLYYPNQTSGTRARSFRAYFRILNGTVYTAPVRIRIADTGETITMDETEQEIETKKYVEDGIFIIERGGVKYDAQGKRIE